MIEIEFPDARYAKNIFEALLILLEEAAFDVYPDKLFLRGMDRNEIAMVELGYGIRSNIKDKEPAKFYVSSLENICQLLSFLVNIEKPLKREKLKMVSDSDYLIIEVTGDYIKRFTIPYLNPPLTFPNIPSLCLNFSATIQLRSKDLSDTFSQLSKINDEEVQFVIDNNEFKLVGESEDKKLEIIFPKSSCKEFCVNEKVRVKYNTEWLKEMMKVGSRLSTNVIVGCSTDKPIKLYFSMPEGYLVYYLAPREVTPSYVV